MMIPLRSSMGGFLVDCKLYYIRFQCFYHDLFNLRRLKLERTERQAHNRWSRSNNDIWFIEVGLYIKIAFNRKGPRYSILSTTFDMIESQLLFFLLSMLDEIFSIFILLCYFISYCKFIFSLEIKGLESNFNSIWN